VPPRAVDGAETEETARQVLTRLYRALMPFDEPELRHLLRSDVFVFTPLADGVCVGIDEVIQDLRRWGETLRERGEALQLNGADVLTGVSPSGDALWLFDRVTAVAIRGGGRVCAIEIRVTALLEHDAECVGSSVSQQIAAAAPEGTDVIKALNTIFGHVLAGGTPLDAFFAGDSAEAKAHVADFLQSLGMRPLDVGGLEMAYVVEWAAILLMGLARNGAGFNVSLGAEVR
jgi:hypothetical protein